MTPPPPTSAEAAPPWPTRLKSVERLLRCGESASSREGVTSLSSERTARSDFVFPTVFLPSFPLQRDHRLEESRMEPITTLEEATRLSALVAINIETAAAEIAEEIARRFADPDHPLHDCQVIWSADNESIWVVTAEGPCLDERYTLVEIYPDRSRSGGCADDEDGPTIGWRVSTPSQIVDLLG